MEEESEVSSEKICFAGDQKIGRWIFSVWEKKFVENTIHLIPRWLETYHLTLMTLVWSAVTALAGYFAKDNINWLWLVSAMIITQYVTDLFDGSVGRHRNTGLVKWGYFMDHFLDYLFLCSMLFAYSFLVPGELGEYGLATAIIVIGFMVNFYLLFAVTNQFRFSYSGIGPTESRLLFIIFNTLIIIFGAKRIFSGLPYAMLILALILIVVVYQSHKKTWEIDMENKKDE